MSSDFGRTALTLGGQVAGFFLGGPIGAAVGSYLGSTLGFALFPLDPQEGPRLDNPQLTSANYGAPVLEVFGRYRVGGVLVDASEIREVAVDTEVGGKGGPEQTVRSYEYFADVMLLLCRGPIIGVRRIWANGKLIFDASTGADVYSLMASGELTESIRFYPGSETQLPDPVFEALRGVGTVPAYRGYAYLVLENFRLETGTLPAFQVEVFTAGAFGVGQPKLFVEQTAAPVTFGGTAMPTYELSADSAVVAEIETSGDITVTVSRIYPGTQAPEVLGNFTVPDIFIEWRGFTMKSRSGGKVGGFYSASSFATADSGIAVYGYDGAAIFTRAAANTLQWGVADLAYYIMPGASGLLCEADGIYVGSSRQWTTVDSSTEGNWHRKRVRVWRFGGGNGSTFDLPADHYTVGIDLLDGVIYVLAARRDSGSACTFRLLTFDLVGTLLAAVDIGAYGHSAAAVYPLCNGAAPVDSGLLDVGSDGVAHVVLLGLKLTAGSAGNDMQVWRIAGGTASLLVSEAQPATGRIDPPSSRPPLIKVTASGLVIGAVVPAGGGVAATAGIHVVPFKVATPATVPLADVVRAVIEQAGVPAASIDVTALSGQVTGYGYGGGRDMRSALQPLADAYFFSVADVDGKLVAAHRGGAVELALAADDLVLDAGATDAVPLDARDESDLPVQVSVGYLNAGQDYESGQQPARRLNTDSTAVEQMALPLVLTDDEAAQIADKRLGALWGGAQAARFGVGLQHLKIAPGAVVTVPRGDRTLRLAVRRCTLRGARIEVEAATESAASFTSYAVGQPAPSLTQAVEYLSGSTVAALDVPILRAQDDGPGFYVGACPTAAVSAWQGAQVYRASGDGAYAPLIALTAAAVIGRTATALPDWPPGETRIDPFGSVEVTLRNGTLASATDDAPHRALIGAEIVQFVTVTAVSAGRYRLSRLLRGIQGTQHSQSGHAAGELFVLLTENGLRRIDDDAALAGVAQTLKAVTFGRTLAGAAPVAFTNTDRRRKCLPPIGLAVSPQADGSAVFTWRRAARKYANRRNPTVVAVEETPGRSYELDVVSPSTGAVLRTLAASDAEQVTYSAANATTDFGNTEYGAIVMAYQLNGAGRGLPGRFVVSTARPGPFPLFLFDGSLDPANFVAIIPLGISTTPANGLDTERTLFGVRSLKWGTVGAAVQMVNALSVGTGDWYIGAWVYIASASLTSVTAYIVDRAFVAGNREVRLGVTSSGAFVEWSGDLSTTATRNESGASALVLPGWNHIAASRSGTTVRLFVNGQVKNTEAAAATMASATTDTRVCNVISGATADWRLQELVMIRGAAYKTAAFVPIAAPYYFR